MHTAGHTALLQNLPPMMNVCGAGVLFSLALSVKLLYILASVLGVEFFWSGVSVPFGASAVLLDLYVLWCGFLYNSKLTAVLYHPDIPAEGFLLLIAAGTTDPEFLPSIITAVTNSHLVLYPYRIPIPCNSSLPSPTSPSALYVCC